ncbi:hypothetical protein [Sulfuricaulis sp.]|uniref:hypothetical protein n=1 Tax=Sulfuricaulis sp. TaxID=2003553 RepID=UPI00355985BB
MFGRPTPPKNTFNILMNYELGMHCTGFEFSYCCVLPPYNSILAQVVKTQQSPLNGTAFPRLLDADPNVGLDFLGRPTVLRDTELDAHGHFKKYVLRYWHDAQPRNDGRGATQTSTLISHVEGNSLLMWNTILDAAAVDTGNKIQYGTYDGQTNVVLGDGNHGSQPQDNYANAWLNHLYIYSDLSGSNSANTSLEKNKIRLGMPNTYASTVFATILPQNSGPAFHPMGPGAVSGLNNVLTFSGDSGTVVFTQMKVLENLPVMLTSPRIWEALGLPLDPFEDTINFFGNPGAINESTVRPYVKMNAQLHNFDSTQPGGIGTAVLQNGNPIIGFGTAPIDIPNCERCHALGPTVVSANNPANSGPEHAAIQANAQLEIEFWNAYYGINTAAGDSDWYSRLKGTAYSILALHDDHHGTSFTANWPQTGGAGLPQVTRLGHESVLCQKCHADNVIAKVKSATVGVVAEGNDPVGTVIPPLTEALHSAHSDRVFSDSLSRNGACQGCHPAHRSDGDLTSYPITTLGLNAFANGDNRDAAGGCYVGRDVHSNRNKNVDLSAQPHLNAVGTWLVNNVASDTGTYKGIWCTNCHTQFSQEIWRAENVKDLIHSKPGDPGNVREPKVNATLNDVAHAVGVSLSQAIAWLDPKTNDDTYAAFSGTFPDANVATIEIRGGGPFVTTDADGDISVRILDFCTTPDCVAAAQAVLNAEHNGGTAVPVPFSAATDGRDHWLSPGEPHCADCHKAPFTEQSGNINPFPPFNYPRKASLFRYSRGHQDITCQGCHESTHGLYPVTPDIDTTTYAQAASLNTDGKHGPLKCGSCHVANKFGVPSIINNLTYTGTKIATNFDKAVSWAHTFTIEADPTKDYCLNCHLNNAPKVSATDHDWLCHAMNSQASRKMMDKVEISLQGHVSGDPAFGNPLKNGFCTICHNADLAAGTTSTNTTRADGNTHYSLLNCSDVEWKRHVTEGRVAQTVWDYVTVKKTGSTCGW